MNRFIGALASCLMLLGTACSPSGNRPETTIGGPSADSIRIKTIGQMGDPSEDDRAFVLDRIGNGDAEERSYAAWTLGKIGEAEEHALLVRVANEDEEEPVRMNAIKAIGEIAAADAQSVLVGFLADTSEEIRAVTLNALAEPRYAAAHDAVGRLLLDLEIPARLRKLAADTLTQMNTPDALPLFEKALGDYNKEVRGQVAYAMGRLRDPRAVPALARLADDGARDVRINAAQALGMIGHRSAKPALQKMTQDEYADVRAVAGEALDKLQ